MLYIILFIQYNRLEHTESDDKMVKEYLKEKADSLTAEKERLTAQKERLDGIRERLYKSIDEVQKKEDVDFEIFSPRADMRVSKEMLNEMHQQINDVKRGNGKAGQVSVHARRGAESAGLMFHMFHVKHFQDFGMLKTGYLKKEVL